VTAKVKPERDKQKRDANRERWWQFAEKRPGLTRMLRRMSRALVVSRIGNALAFVFLDATVRPSEKIVVFTFESYGPFAIMQSRVHEVWARFFSSTLKDDLQYTPSDCFETFPFPRAYEECSDLAAAGETYYEFRKQLMMRKNEGLTQIHNRFHDLQEESLEIIRLRELHEAMDRAAIHAYGWNDIDPRYYFIPEFDGEENDDENVRQRKKKYRYRWPDEIRDEILARLLQLNRQRTLEEGQLLVEQANAIWAKPQENGNRNKVVGNSASASVESLFENPKGDD
jgi:hypothetical protein